jgi:hypothetical protein
MGERIQPGVLPIKPQITLMIITTKIRENIALSMDKPWVSCQTWTSNDLKLTMLSGILNSIVKRFNTIKDIHKFEDFISKIFSGRNVDKYYTINNLPVFASELYKMILDADEDNLRNSIIELHSDELSKLFDKHVKICVSGEHTSNMSSRSVNRSAVAWKYIATAYIVKAGDNISKNTVLKRITIVPRYNPETMQIFYSPIGDLLNISADETLKHWQQKHGSIYINYQKDGFYLEHIMDNVHDIFKNLQLKSVSEISNPEKFIPAVLTTHDYGDSFYKGDVYIED